MPTTTKEQAFENIQKSCEERLNQIYCAGVPKFAKERLEKELKILSELEQVTVFSFEIYRIIAETARNESIPMRTCNGTFIAYLMGYMGLNPLPAHYYCKKCGHSECTIDYSIFGMDLPKKKCTCDNTMISMGIGLPYEWVWEKKISTNIEFFNIRTIPKLAEAAQNAVSKVFPLDDFLANTEVSIRTVLNIDIINSEETVEDFIYHLQNRTGVEAHEIRISDISEFNYHLLTEFRPSFNEIVKWFDTLKPSSFRDFSKIVSLRHWYLEKGYAKLDDIVKILDSESFKKYPFIEKEDVFIYLIQNGVSSKDAIEMCNLYSPYKHSERLSELFQKYNLDEELKTKLKEYRFSRTYNAPYIYHLMIITKYLEILRR